MDYSTPRPYELLGLSSEDLIEWEPVPDNFGWDLTHDDEQEQQQEQEPQQVQHQVQDSSNAIVAPDAGNCVTREEQLPFNLHQPLNEPNVIFSWPVEQSFDDFWHGSWAIPHQPSRHGTTGLLPSQLNERK